MSRLQGVFLFVLRLTTLNTASIPCVDAAALFTSEDVAANKDVLDGVPHPYEIVFPVQMRMNEVLPDLDTRDPKAKIKVTDDAALYCINLEYRIQSLIILNNISGFIIRQQPVD